MNYLAHAYRFLDNPYFVAGVALPDWLSVVGRQYRARAKSAENVLVGIDQEYENPASEENLQRRSFLKGVIQHHRDDYVFHQSETFVLLSAHLSVSLRAIHGPGSSIRSGFLGHIVIELLLDDWLCKEIPTLLEDYYGVVDSIDRSLIAHTASQVVGKEISGLPQWIDRFVAERFLDDYANDQRLLYRLNQVMKRVRLEPLGDEVLDWLSYSRELVHQKSSLLLPPI